jgi:hypothetical protein
MTTFSYAIRTVPQRADLFLSLLARISPSLLSPSVLGLHVSPNGSVAPNENGCRALDAAALDRADWVLFLEDDADPIDDFLGSVERWLTDFATDDVHIYPLGSPLTVSNVPAVQWPISQFYCSVALAIRGSLVGSLVAYLRANSHVRTGFDIMAGHWHRTVSPSNYLIAAQPCLVDHVGDESTLIDTRPGRNVVGRFERFIGRDFSYKPQSQNERQEVNLG